MSLPPEYFENKVEQCKIKEAINDAIPDNVKYSNLIIAISEMLVDFANRAFRTDNNKDVKDAIQSHK